MHWRRNDERIFMKLKKIKLVDFRGYHDPICVEFDNLTAFLGKNDIGKSTILEALDIFFNEGKGAVKFDAGDIYRGADECSITLCFTELPETIVLDSANSTSLSDEYMLNEDNELEIIKKYKRSGSPKVYLRAMHPNNENCSGLLLKKNTDLKTIIRQESITCDDQTRNASMRSAIWNHYQDELNLQITEIDASKEDAKKIWEKIVPYLPSYSLFQADRKNSDTDNEVQDPLKEAVKQILSDPEIQEKLNAIAEIVETKLQEVSTRTLDKLREMDSSIANSLNPVIPSSTSLKWQDVFKNVSITSDDDIPINKRGSGVKRMILLNFFRAEVERRTEGSMNTGIIYAIEEPETAQHTANQRILIESLKQLSNIENTQVIITTHSAFLVKQLQFSQLRLITASDSTKEVASVEPNQLSYPSLNEVNYLAFGELSEEYHDELWAHIEENGWKTAYFDGKPRIPYNKIMRNGTVNQIQITLTEFIRHQIHHPENTNNPRFTRNDLEISTNMMRQFISQMIPTEGEE